MRRLTFTTIAVIIAAAVGVGGFLLGRSDAGRAADSAYNRGLYAGQAEGVRYGRALQATLSAPDERQAFDAGYVTGENDAFGGYDGGWEAGLPYVVVVAPGTNGVTYRFASRTPMQPGVTYTLCGKALCQTRGGTP
jgi:hypothetical protein